MLPWASAKTWISMWRGRCEVALEEDRAVAERGLGLAPRPSTAPASSSALCDDAHPLAAAAGRGLDQQRKADRCRDRGRVGGVVELGAGDDRDAGVLHQRPRSDLRAHRLDRARRRADPDEAGVDHRPREVGVLGEEAVAGVDRVGAGQRAAAIDHACRRRDRTRRRSIPPSATASSASATNGAAASGSEWTATVAMPIRRQVGEDAAGDLAAVGDQHLRDRPGCRRVARSATYIRKTPKRPRALDLVAQWTAESAMPSTVRVSRGSIIPSSQSSPEETKASDSRSICSSIASRVAVRRSSSTSIPRALSAGAGDDLHHAAELLGAHHRGLVVRPGEDEARLEAAPAHAVVAGAVGAAHHQRQLRHAGVGDGVDHLRAGLDDPALLVVGADDVAGRVLQEEQRRVDLVGELDEVGGLLGVLVEEHAVVGEDRDRIAVELRPAGDELGAVERA